MTDSVSTFHIDRNVCTGHARCNAVAPQLFSIDDDGLAVLQHQPVTPAEQADAARASLACPEQAIS